MSITAAHRLSWGGGGGCGGEGGGRGEGRGVVGDVGVRSAKCDCGRRLNICNYGLMVVGIKKKKRKKKNPDRSNYYSLPAVLYAG